VEVPAIDDRHLHPGVATELARSVQAAEATSDDHDAMGSHRGIVAEGSAVAAFASDTWPVRGSGHWLQRPCDPDPGGRCRVSNAPGATLKTFTKSGEVDVHCPPRRPKSSDRRQP
jgi:hypothetical protein